MQEKILVAVYGTLRKGFGNYNYHLNNNESKYIGSYDTEPIYTMYSLGGFPGIKEEGTASIKMEVFAVTPKVFSKLDILEGYSEGRDNNHYERKVIETPYGKAYTYIYNHSIKGRQIIESGDWNDNYKLANINTIINA